MMVSMLLGLEMVKTDLRKIFRGKIDFSVGTHTSTTERAGMSNQELMREQSVPKMWLSTIYLTWSSSLKEKGGCLSPSHCLTCKNIFYMSSMQTRGES